jgi:ABC-type amino acid transport substrate-binding protein
MSRLRTLLFVMGMLALLAALWLLLPPRDPVWARLQRGEPLRVALDPTFPPFETLDEAGRPVGFDVDLAHELGRRLNVSVQFQAIAFDGLADAVIAGKSDAVISAFPLDPRLSRDVAYSRPYFEAGLVWVTTAAVAPTPDTVGAGVVAAEWGSLGDAWARERGLDVLRCETPAEALAAVAEGRAVAAVVDAVTAALALPAGLIIHNPPLASDPYVILMPRRAEKLVTAVNEALAAILADGTWARLVRRYFVALPPHPAATD